MTPTAPQPEQWRQRREASAGHDSATAALSQPADPIKPLSLALKSVLLAGLTALWIFSLDLLETAGFAIPTTLVVLIAGGLLLGVWGGVAVGVIAAGYYGYVNLTGSGWGSANIAASHLATSVALLAVAVCVGFLYEAVNRLRTSRDGYRRMGSELAELTGIDALTGIANRRRGDVALRVEAARAQRSQRPCAVVLFDVDRFKRINDVLGHDAGDRTLRNVARVLERSVRPMDLAVRWGGEEFLVIYPDTDLAGAVTAANRVRYSIEQSTRRGVVTISGGVAELEPTEPPEDALRRADRSLYRAKRLGRNQVVAAAPHAGVHADSA